MKDNPVLEGFILEAQNHRFVVSQNLKLIQSNHTRRKKKSGIRNEYFSSLWRMGWLYKLRSGRRNHKGKDRKQTGKIPTANMTKDYYLYYVKSARNQLNSLRPQQISEPAGDTETILKRGNTYNW